MVCVAALWIKNSIPSELNVQIDLRMHTAPSVWQIVRLFFLLCGISTLHTAASLSLYLYIYFSVRNVWEGSQDGKVEIVSTPWRYTGRVEVELHQFRNFAVNGCEWLAARPGRFTSREKSTWHPLNRRLSGLHSLSECCGEEKNLSYWDWNTG